jgi:hypothetical protein
MDAECLQFARWTEFDRSGIEKRPHRRLRERLDRGSDITREEMLAGHASQG